MTFRRKQVLLPLALLLLFAFLANFRLTAPRKVDYNAEVKPLLNKHCLHCHGGVRRKSGFSLLTREDALAPAESGKPAIVPGKPEESEFIRRLNHHDAEERMPYGEQALSSQEIDLLKRWVKEGAQWNAHWSFVPVEQVEVPKPKGWLWGLLPARRPAWVKTGLDFFILEKIKAASLAPSPEADKAALLRRVSLDLTGLPAPESLAEKFLADASPDAYERLVDSLLASPAYGERWTSLWLDLARYADTKGYERDDSRRIWRYRDWLIRAFNADMPYDQFLTEQLAGDLLPHPTDEQLTATAFHRNTMTNDEGGTDNEEFRTAAVLDRVGTTWEALMGTTFACVQCHDHPYDPFRHEEFYQFTAFFNDTRDADTYEEYPVLRHFAPQDSLRLLELRGWAAQAASPEKADELSTFLKTWQPARYSLETDSLSNAALYDTKWLGLRQGGKARLPNVNLEGKSRLIFRCQAFHGDGRWTVRLGSPAGQVLFSKTLKGTKSAWTIDRFDFPPQRGVHDLWFFYENPRLPNPESAGMHFDWFHFTEPLPGEGKPNAARLASLNKAGEMQKTFWELLRKEPPATTPVMFQNPPDFHRPTHVFERGNWLVKGKPVEPGVPKTLPPLPAGAPADRLALARWMTRPDHPLTARTMVNRVWEQLFGAGLAETLEDLGSQGIPPTHRELLDWLAWNFLHEQGWSLKRLLRSIVLSATYRQDAKASPELLEKDPNNRLLARGARVRLSAEQLRDCALSAAGILNPKMYGASVMPHQPPGIWLSPWADDDWVLSEGGERHRRAIYTFWKRTSPYPAMMTFDGAAREVCTSRRVRTNTPLQALVTLNDEAFLEAARHLARRMRLEGGSEPAAQLAKGYALAMGRPVSKEKLAVLEKLRGEAVERFEKDEEKAKELCGGEETEASAELAALVVAANALMNLDEFVTK